MRDQRAVRSRKAGHHAVATRSGKGNGRNQPDGTHEPMPTMDIGTALDLLAAAVSRRGGDFVYQPVWVDEPRYLTCLYARDGAPDCIVGHVLAAAGVRPRELEAMRDDGIEDLYRADRLPIDLTLGALAVLHTAQQSQDRGCPWGDLPPRTQRRSESSIWCRMHCSTACASRANPAPIRPTGTPRRLI